MLFIARSEPESKPSQLISLCCSLNSPVVSIPELPVGPAGAAIAIHTDADSGSNITVAVQCRRTAGVVLFRARGESGDSDGVSARAALLWAESMGFLFDEELCTDPGNEKGVRNETATEIWRELVQGAQPTSVDPEPCSDPVGSDAAAMLSKFRFQRDAWSRADSGATGPKGVAGAVASLKESIQQPSSMAAAVT